MTQSDRPESGILSVSCAGPVDGPPVVVLHGWGSSAKLMEGFVERLKATHRVFNVDLPGHGAAPVPAEPLDMDDHARAVASVIAKAGGPAHVIGHSNGGRIGLYMASDPEYSLHIRSLSLISPSGTRRPRTLTYHLKVWLARALKAPFNIMPSPMKEAGLDWLRHSLVWKALGSSDYRRLSGGMRGTFVNLVNTYVEDRLGLIAVPTLVFWGTNDDAVLRPQIDKIVSAIPDAGLVELPGAGHYGFLDAPDLVFSGTAHFLASQKEVPA